MPLLHGLFIWLFYIPLLWLLWRGECAGGGVKVKVEVEVEVEVDVDVDVDVVYHGLHTVHAQ